jgi:CMP-N-acetylneuraminic acid synthetase
MIVALIPARGGSKRLPRKNLLSFAGKPLIYYSIALAQRTPGLDRCVVSTEDDEVADVARSYGAEVIMRPVELAGDNTPTAAVARHVATALAEAGSPPSLVITLQPTSPLRPPAVIEQALALFEATRPDSVVAVASTAAKTGSIADGRYLPAYTPGIRAQDMPPRYRETGLVYASDARLVLERGDLFGERIVPLVSDPLFPAIDIDTALDFETAECLFTRHRHLFTYA